MFGHDDDDQANTDTAQMGPAQTIEPTADAAQPTEDAADLSAPADNPALPAPSDDNSDDKDEADAESTDKDTPSGAPVADVPPATEPVKDSDQPLMALPEPATGAPEVPDARSKPAEGSEDLMAIKQEALQQLSPLVGHLDQTPEEKFHTTMMMIQAADDQTLVQDAYDAAKAITDDKARAQALLDIINEINYFTQHQTTEQ